VLDLDQTAEFIESLYPTSLIGRLSVMALMGDGAPPRHQSFARGDMKQLLQYVDDIDRAEAQGTYLRISTVHAHLEAGRRGSVDDSVELVGLIADLDYANPAHHKPLPSGSLPLPPDTAAAIRLVTESRLPEPTTWVLSGAGVYGWWVFPQPLVIADPEFRARVARLSEAWQREIAASAQQLGYSYGTSVSDLARVLRLPGSVSRKDRVNPKLCRVFSSDGPRYSVEELAGAIEFDLFATVAPRASVPPSVAKPSVLPSVASAGGDLSPFDDYESKTSWSQILLPLGWQLDERRSRAKTQFWVRPGKNIRDGHSATTGRADDRDRLYCFSDAAGLTPNTPMTKPFVYAQLHHGGNLKLAAKTLREEGFGSETWAPDDDLILDDPPCSWKPELPTYEPITLDEVHDVFSRWLGSEYDLQALDAVLACAAVEQLDGDPVWLLALSGPGAAKTETVSALAGAGALVVSTISSEGALLSATSKREVSKSATGGLLRQLGDRGIIVLKDLTSLLSMNKDMRATVLAALREVYDGKWVRLVGADGGRTLEWEGRLTLISAVTSAYDAHHAIISSMGDRFALVRMDSSDAETRRVSGWQALRNVGREREMRAALTETTGRLLASVDIAATVITDAEMERLFPVADVVTRARTAVERDSRGEPDWAHQPEAPTRLVKMLAQILRGGLAIGMDRADALELAVRVGRDSMPPLRLDVLTDVAAHPGTTTSDCSQRLQRPRMSIDRTLQELQLLGLLEVCRKPGFVGQAPGWLWRMSDGVPLECLGYEAKPQSTYDDAGFGVPASEADKNRDSFVAPSTLCACPNGGHGVHRSDCIFYVKDVAS
jgi:hypothetical protein